MGTDKRFAAFIATWIGGLIAILAFVDLEERGLWPAQAWTAACFAGFLLSGWLIRRWSR